MARDPRNTAIVPYGTVQDAAINAGLSYGGARMAGGNDPGLFQGAQAKFNKFLDGKRMAGGPKVLQQLTRAGKVGVPLAGLSLLGSALAAGQELKDDGDSAGRNLSQAGGRMLGDMGTTAALAGLGFMVGGPLGMAVVPTLGALLQVQDNVGKAGAGLAGGVYDVITRDTPEKKKARNFRLDTQLLSERMEALGPVMNTLAKMEDARAIQVAKQNYAMASDYNYANSLNQSRLNREQSASDALAIAMQNLL